MHDEISEAHPENETFSLLHELKLDIASLKKIVISSCGIQAPMVSLPALQQLTAYSSQAWSQSLAVTEV